MGYIEEKTDLQKQTSTQIKQLKDDVQRIKSELKLSREVTTNQSVDLDKRYNEKDALSKEVSNIKKVIQKKDLEISG